MRGRDVLHDLRGRLRVFDALPDEGGDLGLEARGRCFTGAPACAGEAGQDPASAHLYKSLEGAFGSSHRSPFFSDLYHFQDRRFEGL